MRNGFKIALILSSFLIFAGCESSSMNNPDDGDENILEPIYILPNAILGGGLKRRVELWGEVK